MRAGRRTCIITCIDPDMSLRRPGLGMIAAALLAVGATVSPVAHADTVASLLGNFTINQFSALSMTDGAVDVHRVIVFGQLPALRELHAADADGDGVTTQAERDAYATKLARSLADSLELTVDGARVPLAVRARGDQPAGGAGRLFAAARPRFLGDAARRPPGGAPRHLRQPQLRRPLRLERDRRHAVTGVECVRHRRLRQLADRRSHRGAAGAAGGGAAAGAHNPLGDDCGRGTGRLGGIGGAARYCARLPRRTGAQLPRRPLRARWPCRASAHPTPRRAPTLFDGRAECPRSYGSAGRGQPAGAHPPARHADLRARRALDGDAARAAGRVRAGRIPCVLARARQDRRRCLPDRLARHRAPRGVPRHDGDDHPFHRRVRAGIRHPVRRALHRAGNADPAAEPRVRRAGAGHGDRVAGAALAGAETDRRRRQQDIARRGRPRRWHSLDAQDDAARRGAPAECFGTTRLASCPRATWSPACKATPLPRWRTPTATAGIRTAAAGIPMCRRRVRETPCRGAACSRWASPAVSSHVRRRWCCCWPR